MDIPDTLAINDCRRWQRACRLHTLDRRRIVMPRVSGPGFLTLVRGGLLVYTLTVWIASVAYDAAHGDMSGHFAYFTYLSHTGLLVYFASSFICTAYFWSEQRHLFSRLPRTLQLLHWLLFESAVVFAVTVMLVFWIALYNPDNYTTTAHRWITISVHAANVMCILLELMAGAMKFSPHWTHPLVLVVIIGLYLALAYMNRAINGWFTYDFLDYDKHTGPIILGIVLGIGSGMVIAYYIVYCAQLLLERLLPPRCNTAKSINSF
ncbi:hypothetical protein GGF46_004462 [Coemansia sp. RSA 552]|nr:hypothetical protein GGF46_004462 [Coemansia sp. RSA 552]